MSLNDIFTDFETEIESAENTKVESIVKPTKIETSLFTIELKDFDIGDTRVAGNTGLHVQALIGLADKFIQLFAYNIIQAKVTSVGKKAVAEETAPNANELFNEDGSLKEEHKSKISDSSAKKAELEYARAVAYWQVACQLVSAWPELMPNSRDEPQLAWKTEERKPIKGFTHEALKEAAKYRMDTSPTLRKVKAVIAQQKKNEENSNVSDINDISKVLGF